jgi:hypothetical protein
MVELFLDINRTTQPALIKGSERTVCIEGERLIRAGWKRNQFCPRMLVTCRHQSSKDRVLHYLTDVVVELEDEQAIPRV